MLENTTKFLCKLFEERLASHDVGRSGQPHDDCTGPHHQFCRTSEQTERRVRVSVVSDGPSIQYQSLAQRHCEVRSNVASNST